MQPRHVNHAEPQRQCRPAKLVGALERLFVTSVGSELAASAKCPVVVVPPDYGA